MYVHTYIITGTVFFVKESEGRASEAQKQGQDP